MCSSHDLNNIFSIDDNMIAGLAAPPWHSPLLLAVPKGVALHGTIDISTNHTAVPHGYPYVQIAKWPNALFACHGYDC